MNKMAIHTHVIFRPHNAMFFLLKIVHFCYFQNTFSFVSTFRKTNDIRKKRRTTFAEQGVSIVLCFPLCKSYLPYAMDNHMLKFCY